MFLALLAFLLTFLVTRTITRLIRSGKGPFGNVSAGEVHIHHVVPGLIVLLLGGVLALGSGEHGIWRQIAGLTFGIGAALVLDEFAMILHMQDVYWTQEGRLSADAVTLAAVVLFCAMLVAAPNQAPPDPDTDFWVNAIGALMFVLLAFIPVFVTILKGKLWVAAFSIAVPFIAWVAMFRLAKPGSPWAHYRYAKKPRKAQRAAERSARWARRQEPIRSWIQEHLFGLSKDTADQK